MSESTTERWHTAVREGNIYGKHGDLVARVGEARTDRLASITDHMIADHNACIGIIDALTTVPELVEVCAELLDKLNMAHVASEALARRARAVLAKRKGLNDE